MLPTPHPGLVPRVGVCPFMLQRCFAGQVEGSRLKKGGWVCGNAWFGSVTSVVELMIRKGVHSSECHQTLLHPLHCSLIQSHSPYCECKLF